jgi:hypothetical protein
MIIVVSVSAACVDIAVGTSVMISNSVHNFVRAVKILSLTGLPLGARGDCSLDRDNHSRQGKGTTDGNVRTNITSITHWFLGE